MAQQGRLGRAGAGLILGALMLCLALLRLLMESVGVLQAPPPSHSMSNKAQHSTVQHSTTCGNSNESHTTTAAAAGVHFAVLCDDAMTVCFRITLTVNGATQGGTYGVNCLMGNLIQDVMALLACDQFTPSKGCQVAPAKWAKTCLMTSCWSTVWSECQLHGSKS